MGMHVCAYIFLVCFVLLYANLFIYISTILQFYISNCTLFCPIIYKCECDTALRFTLHRTLYNVLHIIIINTSGLLPRPCVVLWIMKMMLVALFLAASYATSWYGGPLAATLSYYIQLNSNECGLWHNVPVRDVQRNHNVIYKHDISIKFLLGILITRQ